jgi:RNA polymerase sigma factor (sigma-70 family)
MSTVNSGVELKRVYKEVRIAAHKRGKVGIHDYEDIAQEAMIRYLNKPARCFTPLKWISLAVNCVTWDFCRKRYTMKAGGESTLITGVMYQDWLKAEFATAVCESPAEAIMDRKYLEIALIGLLGEGTFEIFKLYADGFSYQEIAERLNIKLGTVRSKIHYAKTKARKMLEA